jgi:Cu(I)/Ag(I) efflux system membrane protein CusA/SilA
MPLGIEKGTMINAGFVALTIGSILFSLMLFQHFYSKILRWCLNNKTLFLSLPVIIMIIGFSAWLGFNKIFGWLPKPVRNFPIVKVIADKFPPLGREFMPPLDEGSFLFMPTTSPHASIGEVLDVIAKQDAAINQIPEIELAVGKLGRAETPLDPAPISMIETIINYKPEFFKNGKDKLLTFKFDKTGKEIFKDVAGKPVPAPDGEPYYVRGKFLRDKDNKLIPDKKGKVFRIWRKSLNPELNPGREFWRGIKNPDDIWDEIIAAAKIPGTTSAPKLRPIAARIVMLQSGMRAPMGVKIKGPDLKTIEKTGIEIEKLLKQVPSVNAEAVNADRLVGKPYLEIDIDRKQIARYGISISDVQSVIETSIGGMKITTTVEGRERYPVRIRYKRELRDSIESLGDILVPAHGGAQIPIKQLAKINYVRGPQSIKSEDTFLIGYVLFDKKKGFAEVDVVEQAKKYLQDKIKSGEFVVPAGVSYTFEGSYKSQVRARKKMMVILPLALFVIFMILYMQFKSTLTTSLVFSGIIVAWAGGFIMIWLYGQPWFLDFSILGTNMRDLFQIHPINLSVAIWVGFLALFGIASDNGVIMATYLDEQFSGNKLSSIQKVREMTILAGERRVRPALMTTATTILALIPVLTSVGRGADIMVPMAIPSFGGMTLSIITMLIVPVLYCAIKEFGCKTK